MIPRDYQEELSDEAVEIIRRNMIVYLSWEERTGKSLTSLLICEKLNIGKVLIISTPNAIRNPDTGDGWLKTLAEFEHEKIYVTVTHGKIKPHHAECDLVIIDEAHKYISGYPKPSSTWKKVKQVTWGKPIIYLSATPHAQGYQLLYHQFALSKWSPWNKYSNFYNWFRHYGKPVSIKLHNRTVNQYHKTKEELIHPCIDHLFISRTRKQLSFPFEPKDKLHYIEPSDITKEMYNTFLKHKILKLGEITIMCDSIMKLRSTLHMLEGGTVKTNSLVTKSTKGPAELVIEEREKIVDGVYLTHYYFNLGNTEKIDYIQEHWGDSEDVAIMYNYKAERVKLERAFTKIKLMQATSNAEGVDLTHIQHLIIYSQDFSTARHTQRRARQAGMVRDSEIIVHYLMFKKGISAQVHKTVSVNKQNFVDKHFERTTL